MLQSTQHWNWLSPFHEPVIPCCPQSTEKLAYVRPWVPDSEWTELWSEPRLDAILVLVAHFKSTLCRDKGELLRWVEPVPYCTSMCVMSVWPHYHRLLGNGPVGRVNGDSGPKRSHVCQSLRILLLSHFVIVVVWLLLPPSSPISSSPSTLSHHQSLKPSLCPPSPAR